MQHLTTKELKRLANARFGAEPGSAVYIDGTLARIALMFRPVDDAPPASAARLRVLARAKAARVAADRLRDVRRTTLRTMAEANGMVPVSMLALMGWE